MVFCTFFFLSHQRTAITLVFNPPPPTVVHVPAVDSPSTGGGLHVLGPTTSREGKGQGECDNPEQEGGGGGERARACGRRR